MRCFLCCENPCIILVHADVNISILKCCTLSYTRYFVAITAKVGTPVYPPYFNTLRPDGRHRKGKSIQCISLIKQKSFILIRLILLLDCKCPIHFIAALVRVMACACLYLNTKNDTNIKKGSCWGILEKWGYLNQFKIYSWCASKNKTILRWKHILCIFMIKKTVPYSPRCMASYGVIRVGITKAISSAPLISRFFTIFKTLVTYWLSCSYLTGVAAAQLRWHLSNMNVIQII